MIATFLFTFSLALVQQSAQPTPAATLPPEIIHTVTSETCNALSSLLLPVGYTSKVNDKGFDDMSNAVGGYMSHIMFGDAPNIKRPSLEVASDISIGARVPSEATKQGGPSLVGYDPTYGPEQTIKMSRINAIAGQLAGNITYERRLLEQSYREQPRGKNSALDALRQKTEDTIEAQNVLVQRFQNFASVYLENIGEVGIECNSEACAGAFNANLRALIYGSSVGLETTNAAAKAATTNGYKDLKQLSKTGTAAEVVGAMRFNEKQFTAAMYDLYNQCHGTHYVVPETTRDSATVP